MYGRSENAYVKLPFNESLHVLGTCVVFVVRSGGSFLGGVLKTITFAGVVYRNCV